MANSNPNIATRFAPGNSHGGRSAGARARLSAKFQQALADDFDQHGDAVIQMVRSEDPSTYLSLVAKLQPREVEAKLQIEQRLPGNLDPASWSTLRRVIDMIEQLAPAGADPLDVFEKLEAALVQAYAEPAPALIEHQPGLIAPVATPSPASGQQIDLEEAIAATLPPPPY